ncbi:hypothetical protein [Yersinia pestis]|uniref:hypothetical protein n=1 Tax=Yersinia pestis TaxID=632 RepID=UPI001F073BF3|nr:hypothetical protein [Yersinia pestis]
MAKRFSPPVGPAPSLTPTGPSAKTICGIPNLGIARVEPAAPATFFCVIHTRAGNKGCFFFQCHCRDDRGNRLSLF